MEYEWDDNKAAVNLRNHGVPFDAVEAFEWSDATILEDDRQDYGERRFIAYGPIGDRLHCLVFTLHGPRVRVISLRKANRREVNRYG